MCKEVGVGDINLAYNSLYLIEVSLCLLCSGLHITCYCALFGSHCAWSSLSKAQCQCSWWRVHLSSKTGTSFLFSFTFFFLSLYFRLPSLIHRSLYISVSEWGEEKKWSRQEIYPSERQVWINKEEVYSALPKRESWRETGEGFFFPQGSCQILRGQWTREKEGKKKEK